MTRQSCPPYLTATRAVIADRWRLAIAGQPALEAWPEALEHWDYATDLTITVSVATDPVTIRADCALAAEDGLELSIAWRSAKTRLRGMSAPVKAERGENHLELVLPGRLLGESLTLEALLYLADPVEHDRPSVLSARRPGSILWRDAAAVRIEGLGARFPMEYLDFSKALLDAPAALWWLKWTPDNLEDPLLGSACLYLNSSHPVIQRVTQNPDATEETAVVTSAMEFDIFRQLLFGALRNDDFTDGQRFDDGSVGAVVRSLVSRLPGESIASLKAYLEHDEARLIVRLQNALKTFDH